MGTKHWVLVLLAASAPIAKADSQPGFLVSITAHSTGPLNAPLDVAHLQDGNGVTVVSINEREVYLFSTSGDYQLTTYLGFNPDRITTTDIGKLLTIDSFDNRVFVLEEDGTFIARWGKCGEEPGQFRIIRDIAWGPDGLVYVADSDRIQRFTIEGDFQDEWSVPAIIRSLLVAPDGSIYSLSWIDRTVEKYDPSGALLKTISEADFALEKPFEPVDLAMESTGKLHIVDLANQRVHVVDEALVHQYSWGRSGQGPDEFQEPYRIAISETDLIAVADWGQPKVMLFQANESTSVQLVTWGTLKRMGTTQDFGKRASVSFRKP